MNLFFIKERKSILDYLDFSLPHVVCNVTPRKVGHGMIRKKKLFKNFFSENQRAVE